MKIEQSYVRQLKLIDAPNLDPITVITEDMAPGKGKITISCYDRSWTSYWGAMGGTVSEFFQRCSSDYLAGNLAQGISADIADEEAISEGIRKRVIAMRRKGEINQRNARVIYDDADGIESMTGLASWRHTQTVFGDEWWYDAPTRPNPDYVYLCRIIDAVRDGLKMADAASEPAPASTAGEPEGGARQYQVESSGERWLQGMSSEGMAVINPDAPRVLRVMDCDGELIGFMPAHADAKTADAGVAMFEHGFELGKRAGRAELQGQICGLLWVSHGQ